MSEITCFPSLDGLPLKSNPKVIVIENVAAAASGDHRRYWDEMESTCVLSAFAHPHIEGQCFRDRTAANPQPTSPFAWRTKRDIDFQVHVRPGGRLDEALAGSRICRNRSECWPVIPAIIESPPALVLAKSSAMSVGVRDPFTLGISRKSLVKQPLQNAKCSNSSPRVRRHRSGVAALVTPTRFPGKIAAAIQRPNQNAR